MPGPFSSPSNPHVGDRVRVCPATHLCPSGAGASAPSHRRGGAAGTEAPGGELLNREVHTDTRVLSNIKKHKAGIMVPAELGLLGAQARRPVAAWTLSSQNIYLLTLLH